MNIGEETERIEFKKSTSELKEGIVSISSILNKHGRGTLYFGVRDDGTVVGQEIGRSTLRDVSRAISSGIKPDCWYEITQRESSDGRRFIEVSFSGNDAPYSAHGKYYQRFADEDRSISDTELEKLFKSRQNDYSAWENASSGESLFIADERLIRNIITNGRQNGRLAQDSVPDDMVVAKLGLIDKDTGCLTNAGNALLSKNRPILVKLACFATETKDTFTKLEHYEGNVFECIERAVEFISQNIGWRVSFDGGARRKETPEVPLEAIREIVVNAFAHGSYAANTAFEIDIFSDRIMVYSPGRFPRGYTPYDFAELAEEPVMLNPHIVNVLFKAGMIESFGTGFKRTFEICKTNGIDWRFGETKAGFRFEFMRPLGQGNVQELSKTEQAVLDAIVKNGYATGEDIAKDIDKSTKTVYRAIRTLRERGIIVREGSDYDGSWVVVANSMDSV